MSIHGGWNQHRDALPSVHYPVHQAIGPLLISARSRVGLLIMYELAVRYGEEPVLLEDIMNVHGIAAEDIATPAFALRKGGLIRSLGAKLRGYGLAREPSAITMMEIVQALEGEAHLSARRCPPDWVWSVLETTVDETLQRVTLESLVNPP